ncbi:MAG: polyketide synthase, partial [Cytophagales bacterium]|nr:polyketide synthase [Cytophagales bacterium]
MAGYFPEAKNVEEFYANLCNARDSVRSISRKRLINTSIPPNDSYQNVGFLEDVDRFDHDFFNISQGEAECMDPQQRLLMQVVYHTIENAGYDAGFFNGSNTSIFVGDVQLNYYRLAEAFDPTLVTGNMNGATAGRIARFFNLRGNAAMVDTTCSSSLVALHFACNDLLLGEADYAFACGVKLYLFPSEKNGAGDVGVASPDGKARAFSAEANGTVSGETVGCVLLKPLAKALADKDVIHAVVKATAVNQDAALSA